MHRRFIRMAVLSCLLAIAPAAGAADTVPQMPALQPTAPGILRLRGEAAGRAAALRAFAADAWTAAGTHGAWDARAAEALGEWLIQSVFLPGHRSRAGLQHELDALIRDSGDPLLECVQASMGSAILGRQVDVRLLAAYRRLPAACPAMLRLAFIRQWDRRNADYGAGDGPSDLVEDFTRCAIGLLAHLDDPPAVLRRERVAAVFGPEGSKSDFLVQLKQACTPAGGDPTLTTAIAALDPWWQRLVRNESAMQEAIKGMRRPDAGNVELRAEVLREAQRLLDERPTEPWPAVQVLRIQMARYQNQQTAGKPTVAEIVPWVAGALAADPTLGITWALCGGMPPLLLNDGSLELLQQASSSQAEDLGIPALARWHLGSRLLDFQAQLTMPWQDQRLATPIKASLLREAAKPLDPSLAVSARTACLQLGWLMHDQELLAEALRAGPAGVAESEMLPCLTQVGFAHLLRDAQRWSDATPPAADPAVTVVDVDDAAVRRALTGLAAIAPPDAESRHLLTETLHWWLTDVPCTVTAATLKQRLGSVDHPSLRLAWTYYLDAPSDIHPAAEVAMQGLKDAPPAWRLLACRRFGQTLPKAKQMRLPMQKPVVTAAESAIDEAGAAAVAELVDRQPMGPDDEVLLTLIAGHGIRGWELPPAQVAHLRRLSERTDVSPWLRAWSRAVFHLLPAVQWFWDVRPTLSDLIREWPSQDIDIAWDALVEMWSLRPGNPQAALQIIECASVFGLDSGDLALWTRRALAASSAPEPVVIHVLRPLQRGLGKSDPQPWLAIARTFAGADPGRGHPRGAFQIIRAMVKPYPREHAVWSSQVWPIIEQAGQALLQTKPADAAAIRHELLAVAWWCDRAEAGGKLFKDMPAIDPALIPSAYGCTREALEAWLGPEQKSNF